MRTTVANSVEIKNLVTVFPDSVTPAIDNLTLSIERGKIIGLVGPDGAGKTTLLRTIIGLLTPTSGNIKTLDMDPKTQRDILNTKIGYMPQKFGLYEDLSVIENLELYADLKDAPHDFDKMLQFTNLKKFLDRLAGKLSGGMKQKLGLACVLLGNPEFLLLDEPSVGVDPISRRELMKMVKELAVGGVSIIWSTAYLDEAYTFDECIVMNEGKIIYDGKPKDLSPTVQGFEDKITDLMGGFNKTKSELAERYVLKDYEIKYPIETLNLVKKYGDFYAVKNNTFHIKRGEIFGLLGPNGAGKSTSFKMMCGLATPTSGTAKIMGEDIRENPSKARSYLGYMAQKFSLYGNLNVLQNLNFFAGVYGLYGKEKKERIDEIIKLFNFKKYLHTNTSELPLGYKQRLSLSCAVIHSPPILFLDEPTSGVDPITRRDFWLHIKGLADKGVTVMVTTHFMDEAEFCDRISLFYRGEAIATGPPETLKKASGTDNMEEAFIAIIEKFDRDNKKETV